MWNILFLEFHRKKKSRWIKKRTEQQNKWNSSDLLMYKILKSQFGLSSGWMKHIKQSSSFCRIKCERKTVTRPDAWGSLTVFIQLSCHRILYIVIKTFLMPNIVFVKKMVNRITVLSIKAVYWLENGKS